MIAPHPAREMAPDVQARGIGKLLMAETFYARLGFNAVRDSFYGDECTIIMERRLAARS